VVESNNQRNLTIRDMMIATAVVAVACTLSILALRIFADPRQFVSPLGSLAVVVMLICTLGMFGFPLLIGVTGAFFLNKSDSPLLGLYAVLIFVAAIGSMPLAFVIAKACAEVLV
jgi:hypothetical protein